MLTTVEQLSTGEYIAAVPALVGYMPTNTIALVFTRGRMIELAVDVALDQDRYGCAAHLAKVAETRNLESVVIIAVADKHHTGPAIDFTTILAEEFNAVGITVRARAFTARLALGAEWSDLDRPVGGVITDTTATAHAIAAITTGRRIFADRRAIAACYTTVAAPAPGPVAVAAAQAAANSAGFAAATLRALAVTVSINGEPTEVLAARVSIMLTTDTTACDALLGVATIDLATAAAIYTALANQMQGAPRMHALAAVAYLHLINGSGTDSLEAITHARAEARRIKVEDNALMNTVTTGHDRIIPLTYLRGLLAVGTIAAAKFGLDLPGIS
ncbi:DUF4192 family protein [Nocardia sp. NPDC058518]|uniref:DUF4192 family protein n=1 Tax=Nocardia sp. NPDC058518 TaxID=3346534 RepID=UPI00365DC03C